MNSKTENLFLNGLVFTITVMFFGFCEILINATELIK